MTIVLIAVFAYLVSAGWLVLDLRRDGGNDSTQGGLRPWWWLALAAVLLHGARHVQTWQSSGAADLHFFSALSLVGLGMAALTTLFGARGRMAALGVVMFPIAALTLLGFQWHTPRLPEALDWRLQLHAWMALLAYATLAIAALLAVMLWLQERALRRHQVHGWLRALPPLVELETLLFRSITVGFILLTATLLTGVLFVEDLLAQHLVHKTVLSVLSWLVFGGLLLGRWRYGWRGTKAVHWTLVAMVLLVLAFFGSKAVLELVLQRTG